MSVQVENLEEKNMIRLTIEVPEEQLDRAMEAIYQRQKKNITAPGFRKGKVPRKVFEQMFASSIYEDAANDLTPGAYEAAKKECGEDIVSDPVYDIVQIEKGKPFIFTADVAVRPDIVLAPYEGVEVEEVDATPTEEEVTAMIDMARQDRAAIESVTRPIESDDTVIIDYEGFADGEPFEGGSATNHSLKIGSHSFIPGFEDQLIGKCAGDEVEINVTFPEVYHSRELEGKDVVFKVKIHDVKGKVVPELDDEFAKRVSEFDNVEDFREGVRKQVGDRKALNARQIEQESAIDKISEASEIDIPEAMLETKSNEMIKEISQQMANQGVSIDQYMKTFNMTPEEFREQIRPEAIKRIKDDLVLDAIVKDAGIEITEEDLEAELKEMSEMYMMDLDELKADFTEDEKEQMRKELATRKAFDLVASTMVVVPKAPEETSEADGEQAGED